VQLPLSFNDPLISPELRHQYEQLVERLPDVYNIIPAEISNVSQIEIETVRDAMDSLKAYCAANPFPDQTSEINFFKIVKPHFHAQLIFWMTVLDIDLNRPVGGQRFENKFYKKKLRTLQDFFERNKEFYQYYRSGQTDRDQLYFLRIKTKWIYPTDPHIIDVNTEFSSGYDFLVASILANDRIKDYLHYLILNKASVFHPPTETSSLSWTASKSGLIELIYALQSGGVCNNGNAGIKELADSFQRLFKVDLGNYYNAFNEIRLRKKSRTSLLDHLKEKVIQKMDTMDDN